MATNDNIKAALSFPADATTYIITDGRTVGNDELLRIKVWFQAVYAGHLFDSEGDPREANANDFSSWLWTEIAQRVTRWEEQQRDAANTEPAVMELDDS